uniref:Uncharacterized protein n=1 Tax=Aegilops tauschii subsp. strangulata TaxID=200361 RepID=A0A453M4P8_AEGTS
MSVRVNDTCSGSCNHMFKTPYLKSLRLKAFSFYSFSHNKSSGFCRQQPQCLSPQTQDNTLIFLFRRTSPKGCLFCLDFVCLRMAPKGCLFCLDFVRLGMGMSVLFGFCPFRNG